MPLFGELFCLYWLNNAKFGQLILGKIVKIVASRYQILMLKCTNSISAGGNLLRPPTPLV